MPKIRSLLHLCRGLLDRRRLIREHGVEHIANTVGVIPGKPHVCTVRSGFLDTDLNFHMNNAAFLIHSEFARWHMLAQGGLAAAAIKNKWQFMVGSQFTRFRYGLRPFQKYELRTDLARVDDHRWMYFRHRFVDPATEKVCAQVLCRAFVYADGGFVDARELTKTMGLDDDRYQQLCESEMPQIEPFLELDALANEDMQTDKTA